MFKDIRQNRRDTNSNTASAHFGNAGVPVFRGALELSDKLL